MSKSREMQVDITKITRCSGAFPCLFRPSVGIFSFVRNVALTNQPTFGERRIQKA
jgi:hypothetical protein